MALRKLAFGTMAISGVNVIRMLAQLFVVPVLSRILSPADYGLVAMAMPFVLFTMMFSDVGIGQSLVRTDRSETTVWSTSFWLTIFMGLGLALLIVASAPAAALFFGEPRLKPIVLGLSFVILMQAGATIPEAYLRQQLKFGTIAAAEIGSVLISIAAAVLVAEEGGGAWALIAQQLVLYTTRFVSTLAVSRLRPRPVFHMNAVREHLVFGRDVLSVSLVVFVTYSMDTFIIGRELGSAILGIYSMAFNFLRLPSRIITGPLSYVIYTHLIGMKDDKGRLRGLMLFLTRALSILIFPFLGMMAAAWHPAFRLFLSEKWLASGNLFAIAAPVVALQTVNGLTATICMVTARTGLLLRISCEFCLMLAVAYALSVWFGIAWFVFSYDCAAFLYVLRTCQAILPLIECPFRDYFRTMVAPALATLICAALYFPLASRLQGDWPQLLAGMGLGALAVIVSVLVQFRTLKSEVRLWK